MINQFLAAIMPLFDPEADFENLEDLGDIMSELFEPLGMIFEELGSIQHFIEPIMEIVSDIMEGHFDIEKIIQVLRDPLVMVFGEDAGHFLDVIENVVGAIMGFIEEMTYNNFLDIIRPVPGTYF